jgi:predicted ATP-grasp superfamily ATP-dependent carboligase
MKALARAIITAVAFLELSEDDVVDPDAVCEALEDIGNELTNCSPLEVQALRRELAKMRASEELNEARPEVLDFLESFLASMGLEKDDVD